ncbi:MAG TPA: DUF488 domain-containing protein [Nitrococcus sp.]|nr:DUF488 domain-containing protein [Nitrococcus sp.]
MTVQIKRIYDVPAAEDGYRVLVDRMWPRGLAKGEARIDRWLKEVAPSTELRRWFGHEPGRWDEFRKRYRDELKGSDALVHELVEKARDTPVTLLFSARDQQHNQAVVLREWLEERLGKH